MPLLTYLLRGLTRLKGLIASLERLAWLVRVGNFEGEAARFYARHQALDS